MGQNGENGSNRWKWVRSVNMGQNCEITKNGFKIGFIGFKMIYKGQITVYYAT